MSGKKFESSCVLRRAALGVAAILSASTSARAATVALDTADNQASVTTLPTGNIATTGYDLFDASTSASGAGDTNILSGVANGGYATIARSANNAAFTGKTTLTDSNTGTTYYTGVVYQYPVVTTSTYAMATVTLGATTPSSFILSVLVDDQNGQGASGYTSVIAVSSTGSGANAVAETLTFIPTTSLNDFYAFTVTNASSGNVITVSAQPYSPGGLAAEIGGLGFASPAPEPTSLALMGIGSIALLARRRGATEGGKNGPRSGVS